MAIVLAALAAAPATQPTTQPAHTPFVTVLLRDWSAWDRNGDGTLSLSEIDRAVRDPAMTGDDAACAAALKLLAENKTLTTPLPPLTQAYFADYDQKALALRHRHVISPASTQPANAEAATVDTVGGTATTRPAARSARLPADWDLYFAASKLRIARGGADRFPNRFLLDNTRQGPLGDCYFVAAVGDVLNRDPAAIRKLLTPVGDGKFRVAFPGGGPAVVVGPLTDAELAISSTTPGDGVWLALLEQALGRSRAVAKTKTDDVEGIDLIRDGGSISASITLMTGHRVGRFTFARSLEGRKAVVDRVLPAVRTALTRALADGRMVLASVHTPEAATTQQAATRPALAGTLPTLPPNINTKHAYAILAYDAKTDVVTFWNPHGQLFHPKGSAGLTNGYPTDHGRFDVPLTEAYQFFTSIAIERPAGSTTRPTTGPTTAPIARN